MAAASVQAAGRQMVMYCFISPKTLWVLPCEACLLHSKCPLGRSTYEGACLRHGLQLGRGGAVAPAAAAAALEARRQLAQLRRAHAGIGERVLHLPRAARPMQRLQQRRRRLPHSAARMADLSRPWNLGIQNRLAQCTSEGAEASSPSQEGFLLVM